MSAPSSGPRKIDVHLALTRPLLLMGCEREALLISATIAATLVFVIGNIAFAFPTQTIHLRQESPQLNSPPAPPVG